MKKISNALFFNWVEQEIAAGHSVRFRLKGYSMLPLLRNELDEVVLLPCSKDNLKPMDVVLFRYRGNHVLHRILYRNGQSLILQGDGSYVAQETCDLEDVVGKVSQIIRPSGKSISVESWQWRYSSLFWVKLGIFRRPILRFLHMLSK